MFHSGEKKAALRAAEEASERYKSVYAETIGHTEDLHNKKVEAVAILKNVDDYIHTLSNKPDDLKKEISDINLQRQAFEHEVDQLKIESKEAEKLSTSTAGAGVMAGAGVAAFGPTAAMAVATTFGTASTGTAIATLSGAAATNAALAWLGGGALAVGGGGMAAGEAFLALAGPVGWVIGGGALIGSGMFANHKNKKIAEEAEAQTRTIKAGTEKLQEMDKEICAQEDAITGLNRGTAKILQEMEAVPCRNYSEFSQSEKDNLRILVNSANALSVKIGEKVKCSVEADTPQ